MYTQIICIKRLLIKAWKVSLCTLTDATIFIHTHFWEETNYVTDLLPSPRTLFPQLTTLDRLFEEKERRLVCTQEYQSKLEGD